MILVVDASVAVKWFLAHSGQEDHTEQALEILARAAQGDIQLVQPPHFMAEVFAVLARLKPADALEDLADLLQIAQRRAEGPEIYAAAIELSVRHGNHLFDTLYHAVALHTRDAALVTADRKYFTKASAEGSIAWLGDFTFA